MFTQSPNATRTSSDDVAAAGALIGAAVRATAGAAVGTTVWAPVAVEAAVAAAGGVIVDGGALVGPHAASSEAPQLIRNARRV